MKKRLQQIPPEERPREKLLQKGAKALMDKELLAILLGKGSQNLDVMTLAEKLIPVIDKKGFRLTAEDLKQFKGIGDAKAAIVLAAIEFTRRRIKPEGFKINAPEDILPHIRHFTVLKNRRL
jgi:DNA repair protein RadC